MRNFLHMDTLTEIEGLDRSVKNAVRFDQECNHDEEGKRLRQPNGETRLLLHIHQLEEQIEDMRYENMGEDL